MEQLETQRFVLMTENRDKHHKKAAKFITGGQSGGIMMFNTHSGNIVVDGLPKRIKAGMKLKTWSDKFDALFALTYALNNYDFWLYDNEFCEECDAAVEQLGQGWKTVMQQSDAELGIDAEFTRPGVEAMLEEFQANVFYGGARCYIASPLAKY